MRRFHLNRLVDVSGISGTGIIAEGCEWHDGQVTLSWFGRYHSQEQWHSVEDMMAVHGHGGTTKLEWVDRDTPCKPSVRYSAEQCDRGTLGCVEWHDKEDTPCVRCGGNGCTHCQGD